MEFTCPLCDSKTEVEATGAADSKLICAVCGASLKVPRQLKLTPQRSAPVRRASRHDGYNVAGRVLKLAPGWLLLSLTGFVLVLLFFSWLSRPLAKRDGAEGEFRNEALNQSPTGQPTREARRAAPDSGSPAETPLPAAAPAVEEAPEDTEATPAPKVANVEENDAEFAVQVGSFDDRSQANEQVSRVRAAGFEARVVEKQKEKTDGVWYQVRCGHFATREDAARLAAQLRAKGLIEKAVIVEPAR